MSDNAYALMVWEPMQSPPRRTGYYAARRPLWPTCDIVYVRQTCCAPNKLMVYDSLGAEYELEEMTDWHGVPTACPDCWNDDLEFEEGSYWCACCGREHDAAEYTPGPLPMPETTEDA
jgi:hypothetical protein